MSTKKAKSRKAAKKKTPKQIIAELTEQNEILQHELATLKTQYSDFSDKLISIVDKLIMNSDATDSKLMKETDIHAISKSSLDKILDNMIVKRKIYSDSLDCQVDLLESQVTMLNFEYARAMKKLTAYECGLDNIITSENISEIKDKVFQLQLIAGQEYHSCMFNDPENPLKDMQNDMTIRPDIFFAGTLQSAHELQLLKTQPACKLPGETHVRHMLPDLKLYIVQELNTPRQSGGNWRVLAERLQINENLVQSWSKNKLPAGLVLNAWSSQPEATVRVLHRHLVSPQMRCTVLGRMLSDYYEIL